LSGREARTFSFPGGGYAGLVIGVGLALLVLGVVFLFIAPWVGIITGGFGLLLAFLWIAGLGSQPSLASEKRVGSDRP
jgi:hypothetical protein